MDRIWKINCLPANAFVAAARDKVSVKRCGYLTIVFTPLTSLMKDQVASMTKVKVGVLRPVQQPGSYWDRSSELPLVGLEPTEVTAYD